MSTPRPTTLAHGDLTVTTRPGFFAFHRSIFSPCTPPSQIGGGPCGVADDAILQTGSTHMRISRWITGVAIALAAIAPGQVHAQGITTGAIAGQVTDEVGRPLAAVQIVISNRT